VKQQRARGTPQEVQCGAARQLVFSPENTPCLPAHSMSVIPFLLRYVLLRLAAQNDVGTATVMQHVRSSSQGTYKLLVGCIMDKLLVGCIMVTVSRVAQSVRAGRPGDRRSIPSRGERIFPLSSVSRQALRPTQPPVQWVTGVLSLGLKRGRGVTLATHPI
jgi:hypothetical protein